MITIMVNKNSCLWLELQNALHALLFFNPPASSFQMEFCSRSSGSDNIPVPVDMYDVLIVVPVLPKTNGSF